MDHEECIIASNRSIEECARVKGTLHEIFERIEFLLSFEDEEEAIPCVRQLRMLMPCEQRTLEYMI